MAIQELAEEVKTEAGLLKATETELALHAKDRANAYAAADPKGLARSLPGIGHDARDIPVTSVFGHFGEQTDPALYCERWLGYATSCRVRGGPEILDQ